jgi:hypothetical protein
MRLAIFIAAALFAAGLYADEIALKNGQKIAGHLRGLSDGQLEVDVFSGYLGGFPTSQSKKVRFSNVRSIKFDGRDDFFSIVQKNDDLTFATIRELSKGKFTLDGKEPIPASSVKALVPSKPDTQEAK